MGENGTELPSIVSQPTTRKSEDEIQTMAQEPATPGAKNASQTPSGAADVSDERAEPRIIPTARTIDISWQFGTVILVVFAIAFIIIMVLRGTLPNKPLLFQLFSNMFLAGTIIFGGGPVVIPLLREYVVSEGWVAPRDFLLGLAIIQAFPGPNFNFAVYLGGLTAVFGGHNAAAVGLIYTAVYRLWQIGFIDEGFEAGKSL